ncbi:creatinine amidohydrolase [Tistlia consotensis]|uniref:Creatinine amidohydrolase n=1 Tax=Tistlia consotensis USBA 355 TaxID=560819 RepID=A0A1Y6CVQ4_9PROT|nr:creatininase family protein [Tistlia consotensis]SMF78194.1 creatinine amidohydrolase [Tistlia consotensis USBA 355]SNS18033.1 creatinine amidohydrolase [Tistlia consotensis]
MRLQLSTWQEVDDYLKRTTAIIIPIGSTEQHGPNGFIGTDALCPETLAFGIGEETGALVAPTLSIGMAQHHLGFSGSITLRPTTLIAVVQDVVNSLARHGFDRFFFLNGHGGNIATVTAAFSEIYAETSLRTAGSNRPPLQCKLKNWWDGEGVQAISKELFGKAEGSHATCSEVSLTYFAYPDHVKTAEMHPEIAPTGPIYDADDYRKRFPDGRIGSNPKLASVEAGERLYKAAVRDLSAEWRAFAA